MGNDLFENGMQRLCEGLAKNTSLVQIMLGDNSISDAGCLSLKVLTLHPPFHLTPARTSWR